MRKLLVALLFVTMIFASPVLAQDDSPPVTQPTISEQLVEAIDDWNASQANMVTLTNARVDALAVLSIADANLAAAQEYSTSLAALIDSLMTRFRVAIGLSDLPAEQIIDAPVVPDTPVDDSGTANPVDPPADEGNDDSG